MIINIAEYKKMSEHKYKLSWWRKFLLELKEHLAAVKKKYRNNQKILFPENIEILCLRQTWNTSSFATQTYFNLKKNLKPPSSLKNSTGHHPTSCIYTLFYIAKQASMGDLFSLLKWLWLQFNLLIRLREHFYSNPLIKLIWAVWYRLQKGFMQTLFISVTGLLKSRGLK